MANLATKCKSYTHWLPGELKMPLPDKKRIAHEKYFSHFLFFSPDFGRGNGTRKQSRPNGQVGAGHRLFGLARGH